MKTDSVRKQKVISDTTYHSLFSNIHTPIKLTLLLAFFSQLCLSLRREIPSTLERDTGAETQGEEKTSTAFRVFLFLRLLVTVR